MTDLIPTHLAPTCPIPISDYPNVLLAHGGGGRLMHELIRDVFKRSFADLGLQDDDDAAEIRMSGDRLAFTTDSFVVRPLQYPGGDIGSLAVYGTVNDLATRGARPLYLSVAFILEEGLRMDVLWQVVQSMRSAAVRAGVQIVTGDTKVVDRGKGDGIFINTTGIGRIEHDLMLSPTSVRSGDIVLVNSDLARHGMAVMALREELAFESKIESDAAPLHRIVLDLLEAGVEPRCIRDVTRGGLATVLNEVAKAARVCVTIDERRVPLREDVRGACEVLGLDPLYVASEGCIATFIPHHQAETALRIITSHHEGRGARIVGEVRSGPPGRVTIKSLVGVERILDMLSGEQLPRIC
jgi:hydrogenase expression/formation protein HypE